MTTTHEPKLPGMGDLVAGKYRVERVIAEGGMGIVVQAMHLQLDERVAIKFLRPDVTRSSDNDAIERFKREARACIKIRSEHVVRVLDIAELEDGAPFMVMEYLDGLDLDQIITAQGPRSIGDAVDYLLQACEALAEAHAHGIIHRDLKPANLFLSRRADGSPCVKVMDFGISKITPVSAKGEMSMTKTHDVMGSPLYMSPEQMKASRNVDPRTDVWAVGTILYELLAGVPPFKGESMPEVCAAVLTEPPLPLSTYRADVPAELERVLLRCLEKNPAARYNDVAELAAGLSPFGAGQATMSASRVAAVLKGSSPSLGGMQITGARNASQNAMTSTEWAVAPASMGTSRPKANKKAVALASVAAVLTLVVIGTGVTFASRGTKSAAAIAPATEQQTGRAPEVPLPAPATPVAVAAPQAVTAVAVTETPAKAIAPPASAPSARVVAKPIAAAAITPKKDPTPRPAPAASANWNDRK